MHIRKVYPPAVLMLCAVAACTNGVRPAAAPSKVYVTGSRLPVPVDSRTGLPKPDPSVQVVTQEQIETTGRTGDLGAALRQLVPAIH